MVNPFGGVDYIRRDGRLLLFVFPKYMGTIVHVFGNVTLLYLWSYFSASWNVHIADLRVSIYRPG